jgi:hypothetical protein
MIKGILSREKWRSRYFHYIDLNAGCGLYTNIKVCCEKPEYGSPVIAHKLLEESGVAYRMWLVEKQDHFCDELEKYFLKEEIDRVTICQGDNKELLPEIANDMIDDGVCGPMGLIYSDENGIGQPWDQLFRLYGLEDEKGNKIFQKMDLLINYPATTEKRVRRCNKIPRNGMLEKFLTKLSRWKEVIKVMDPKGNDEWIMIFATNNRKFRDLPYIDLYDWLTERGMDIVRYCTHTKEELRAIYPGTLERLKRVLESKELR